MNQLLSLISTHALLHQRHRELDGQGRIVAMLEDYAAVAPIMHAATDPIAGKTLADDVAAVVGVERQHLEAFARTTLEGAGHRHPTPQQLDQQLKDETWTVTIGALSAALCKPPETFRRWLKKAKEHGVVIDHEAVKGRPARLSLDQVLTVGGSHVFPDPAEVAEWYESQVSIPDMTDDVVFPVVDDPAAEARAAL